MHRSIIFICDEKYYSYITPVLNELKSRGHTSLGIVTPDMIDSYMGRIKAASLVVTVHSFIVKVLETCKQLRGITKTLTLQDGAIEYRSSKHRFQGIFRYRPLCTDYIAVFGVRSKRLIEAAGNDASKIVVTGSPRFDHYSNESWTLPKDGYLLITMSNRPAYGYKNLIAFYQLIGALLKYCDANRIRYKLRRSRGVKAGGIEAVDKVLDEISEDIACYFTDIEIEEDPPLIEDIRGAYAVITTPSTPSIETMAMRRPLCHLLFDTETIYTESAWTIRNPDEIGSVVKELRRPPKMKMEYQNLIFQENLISDGCSTFRVCNMIEDLCEGNLSI